jgi:hypothetical protein
MTKTLLMSALVSSTLALATAGCQGPEFVGFPPAAFYDDEADDDESWDGEFEDDDFFGSEADDDAEDPDAAEVFLCVTVEWADGSAITAELECGDLVLTEQTGGCTSCGQVPAGSITCDWVVADDYTGSVHLELAAGDEVAVLAGYDDTAAELDVRSGEAECGASVYDVYDELW